MLKEKAQNSRRLYVTVHRKAPAGNGMLKASYCIVTAGADFPGKSNRFSNINYHSKCFGC